MTRGHFQACALRHFCAFLFLAAVIEVVFISNSINIIIIHVIEAVVIFVEAIWTTFFTTLPTSLFCKSYVLIYCVWRLFSDTLTQTITKEKNE